MNKKGGIIGGIFLILFLIVCTIIVVITIKGVSSDYQDYKEYKSFCDERSDICYCEHFTCEFKIQWSSVEGLSEDTEELCEIANRLKDKKMIYRAGCEE